MFKSKASITLYVFQFLINVIDILHCNNLLQNILILGINMTNSYTFKDKNNNLVYHFYFCFYFLPIETQTRNISLIFIYSIFKYKLH